MRKVFIQDVYHNYTVDTSDGQYSVETGTLFGAIQEYFKFKNPYDVVIFDTDMGTFEAVCEEFNLNKNFYKHIYQIMTTSDVKAMRREKLTLKGFWERNNNMLI